MNAVIDRLYSVSIGTSGPPPRVIRVRDRSSASTTTADDASYPDDDDDDTLDEEDDDDQDDGDGWFM